MIAGTPRRSWTQRHATWLANQQFDFVAQQNAFQGYINAMEQSKAKRSHIEEQIRNLLPSWSLEPSAEVDCAASNEDANARRQAQHCRSA